MIKRIMMLLAPCESSGDLCTSIRNIHGVHKAVGVLVGIHVGWIAMQQHVHIVIVVMYQQGKLIV